MADIKSFKQITDDDNKKLSLWLKSPENCSLWDNWILKTRKDYNITYKHIFGKQLRCVKCVTFRSQLVAQLLQLLY